MMRMYGSDSYTLQFIVDGFRELGFNGISQYPHCGQLWALLCYVKPTFYQHKTDKRRTTFNQKEFIENLEKYLNATVSALNVEWNNITGYITRKLLIARLIA